MAIDISTYRYRIGVFNGKMCLTVHVSISLLSRGNILSVLVISGLSLCSLLLILAGDIHPNPGPDTGKQGCNLNICHANVRSLSSSKLLDIQTWLAEEFDIITLSETYIKPDANLADYEIQNYVLFNKSRTDRIGGGVALYLKNTLVGNLLENLSHAGLELLWVEVRSTFFKFLVGVCYRPLTI